MIRGSAVPDRMVAAGIIAYCARHGDSAHGGGVGSKGIRPTGCGLNFFLQGSQNDTGLNRGSLSIQVNVHQTVHVTGKVQDEPTPDCVAGHAGPATPTCDRTSMALTDPDNRTDFMAVAWEGDSHRPDPIVGS